MAGESDKVAKLPEPSKKGDLSVEEALQSRRSVRDYTAESLTLAELSQLLWAAQGKTHPMGLRTAPSPGALYPLELYVVAGKVDDLESGVYKYICGRHELKRTLDGDQRSNLCKAALKQESISDAPVVIVITAVYQRVMKKYGERGTQYTHIEVGAAVQNVYLQARSLSLGTVVIGAFYDNKVSRALALPDGEEPLAIMPVGKPK